MKYFILSTIDYHVLFFHCYQLYIAFYDLYVNPFTINMCGARVKNLVYDKIKVTGISMASGSATLTPKSLIE